MKKQRYIVKSIEIFDSEMVDRLACLSPVSEDGTFREKQREVWLHIDDACPGEYYDIVAERIGQTFFLHHYDRKNVGDLLSAPYHYFDFQEITRKLSWDQHVMKPVAHRVRSEDIVIMGGGIYFSDNKPRFDRISEASKYLIGWGIGIDQRSDYKKFISKFRLLGTRERGNEVIDNKRVFYVPCASCMNTVFDHRGAVGSKKEFALHLNHGFNSETIFRNFKDINASWTTDAFEIIIKNISDAEYVITNSYHGAYWASLLGKKVVVLKTDVPKWSGLDENVCFSELSEVPRALTVAKSITLGYRDECRELNKSFYSKVRALGN